MKTDKATAGLAPASGSAGIVLTRDCWHCYASTDQSARCPHCDAVNPWGESITPEPGAPVDPASECYECRHPSADFGRFRKASRWERADADGEIYECGNCGCTEIVPPQPNTTVSGPKAPL